MFPGYTLVAFDNRGTRQVRALFIAPPCRRSTIATVEQEAGLARDCAAMIGPVAASTRHATTRKTSRQFAGHWDSVGSASMECRTARSSRWPMRSPTRKGVERLLLDSVVVPTFPDPFDRNVLQQMPGSLTSFCAGGACSAATGDFGANVVKLANRLEARPITGKVITPNGKLRTLR